MKNFVSYEDEYSIQQKVAEKIAALAGAFKIRGSVTFANLPTTLTAAMNGYVYNVTDEFTTTELFVEGAGKTFSAGTDVVIVDLGDDETPDMHYNVSGSFINLTPLINKVTATQAMVAPAFSESTVYSEGDVVTYNDILYKFTADHAAGAWDATQVTSMNVKTLVEDAEPSSLTTAQLNALLALLD